MAYPGGFSIKAVKPRGAAVPTAPGAFAPQVVKNTTGFNEGAAAAQAPATPAPAVGAPGSPFVSVLSGMPGVVAANTNADRSALDAASARAASIQSAALQYGGLPAGFQDKYGDVSESILAQAQANPYSETAQAQRQYDQGMLAMKQRLAASGSLESSQLGTDTGNTNYQRGLDLYNLAGKFGSTVNDAISKYAGVLGSNQADLTNALAKGAQDAAALPGNYPAGVALHQAPHTSTGVDTTFAPPKYGPDADYTPDGTIRQNGAFNGPVVSSDGGIYRSGGGRVTFQSRLGKYGRKPL